MHATVRSHRVGWLVAGVTALVVATLGLGRPAEGADRCDGVWVVVDATALGGELTTRCAPGDPADGLEALRLAGHTYEFLPRQPGLVCTIDRRPDPCNGAPTDAYWAYWHAAPGGDWVYSTRGAGNRDPEPGSAEGWAFGAKAQPGRRAPSAEPAPAEDPSPTASPTASPSPASAPTSPAAAPPVAPPASSPADTPSSADNPSTEPTEATEPAAATEPTPDVMAAPSESADPAEAPTAEPSPSPSGSLTAATDDASASEDEGGVPVATLVGLVLVVALGAAAAVRARRRDDGGPV